MANLNLSEFTEKLFVADADHTFIWDTANAISKRVSRNSWLNSGELTSSAPVTISQTWGTTGIYTAAKVNVTETATANSASRLLDLQVGGASLANFSKAGHLIFPSSSTVTPSGPGVGQWVGTLALFGTGGSLLVTGSGGALNISGNILLSWNNDTVLLRDGAANTLALRNSTSAQTFNVYGTWSSITDYRRLSISCDNTTGAATIATNKGSGTASSNAANLILESSNVAGSYSRLAIRSGSRPIIADPGGTVFLPNSTNIGISSRETIGGSFHAFLGFQVLEFLTSGNENVVMGMRALGTATTASRNIAMGSESGSLVAAGTNNTLCDNSVFLGYDTRAALSGQTNQIVIGHTAVGIGSNSVVLGNDSITKTALKGNVGIGTTSPTSKLHVSGNSSPSITVDNTLATGASQLLFKNTVVTGDTDGIFLNGSAQTGFGGAGSLNIKATTGPLAFHTASVTNALSIAQNGAATFSSTVTSASFSSNQFAVNTLGYALLGAPADGVLRVTNNAGNSFNRFQLGGVTDVYPAIARDGAGIKFTGAAAGSTAWIKVPPVAVTALPDATVAGVGARAFVNDALAPTFGSAVTGGGSVPVPVYSTGSAWNVG